MRYILYPVLVMVALVSLVAGTALAMDDSVKATVRALANDAERDFKAGQYEQAYQKFQRAYDAAKVPKLAVWTARSLVQLGKLVRASELFREAQVLAPNELWIGNAQQQAQSEAQTWLAELLPRIPKLRIRVEGAAKDDVEVTVDGVKIVPALLGLGIPCDPGLRQVVGKIKYDKVTQMINVAEGKSEEVVLQFRPVAVAAPLYAPAPPSPVPAPAGPTPLAPGPTPVAPGAAPPASLPPPPSYTPGAYQPAAGPAAPVATPQAGLTVVNPLPPATTEQPPRSSARRTWGFVVLGVGAAGLLTGIGTGIAVMSSGLRAECPNDTCDPSKTSRSSVSNYNTMRTLSTVGFIAGGLGTAAGVTLLLWPTDDEGALQASLWLGPSSAGLAGRF